MKKFLFVFLLLVASTTAPLFLTTNTPAPTADVLTAEPIETTPAPATPQLAPLTDIAGHWAESAIQSLYEKGVVNGYGNGLFGPDNIITRAEVLKIALNAFNQSASTGAADFTDVSPDDWFENDVATGTAIGIVSGYDDHTFRPNQSVTRAEALKIILEAAGFTDLTDTGANFTDVDRVTDWFAKYTAFAKKAGLVSGYSDGTFRGDQAITRAEVCMITQKVIDYLAGQE